MSRKKIGEVKGDRSTTEVSKHEGFFSTEYYANRNDGEEIRGSFSSAEKAFEAAEEMSPSDED